tara:strand:+ start:2758 stop:4875 length:2118 start_codon:yes stop_codon:yes gene_type:complete
VTTFDMQAPQPARKASRFEDLDRVDVRGLLGAIASRYKLIAGLAVGLALFMYVATSLLAPTYKSFSKVMLDPRQVRVMSSDEVVSNLSLSDPVIQSEISVMRSNILIERLIRDLGIEKLETHFWGQPLYDVAEEKRIKDLTWAIRKDLTVGREPQSYVFVISFSGGEPGIVQEIANGVADTYISLMVENRRDSARQATTWIQDQVNDARAAMNRAEEELAGYRAASLDREGGTYETSTQQLGNLTSQLVVARSERVTAEAQYDQLKRLLETQGSDALAKAVTSPLLEKLNEDKLTLQRQDDQWAQSFGPDHPQRKRLRDEIGRVDADLQREAERIIELRRNDLEVARLREQSLADGIQSLEDQLNDMSANNIGLRQLEREAMAARENYEALLSRLSAASGQESLQRPEARVIERATYSDVPAAPRPKLLAAFGLVLGLTAGIVAALFLEMTRSTFRTRREVEAETGLSVLASLPLQPQANLRELVRGLRINSNTMLGEKLRQLRTMLSMREKGVEARVVMVTSSHPGEGKSTTAMGLAQMAALAGKSVIVVDGDLRRSRLAETFGWDVEYDFADFILETADLPETIHLDSDMGVHFLAAGTPCQEAADDLSEDWLRPLMAELKRCYDLVIIDTPPLVNVADGLVFGAVAESIIYVVRWDDTRRTAVRDGLDALSEVGLRPTGIVLNQVDPKAAEKIYGDSYAAYA